MRTSLLYEVKKRGEVEHLANHKGASYLTMHHFMQNLLERKYRMSMRSGLEVRVPFADHELWEYVWTIPLAMKQMGGHEKGLLRASSHSSVPWFGQMMQTPQLMAYLVQLEDWVQMYGVEFHIR